MNFTTGKISECNRLPINKPLWLPDCIVNIRLFQSLDTFYKMLDGANSAHHIFQFGANGAATTS